MSCKDNKEPIIFVQFHVDIKYTKSFYFSVFSFIIPQVIIA